eukprot:4536093-Lingulodinium_polyedra.AAC.1
MNFEFVKQVLAELARHDFQVLPPGLHQRLQDTFSGPSTAVVEHAFRGQRMQETRHQDNKRVSSTRKWAAAILQELLGTQHRYEEVAW